MVNHAIIINDSLMHIIEFYFIFFILVSASVSAKMKCPHIGIGQYEMSSYQYRPILNVLISVSADMKCPHICIGRYEMSSYLASANMKCPHISIGRYKCPHVLVSVSAIMKCPHIGIGHYEMSSYRYRYRPDM